MPLSTLANGCYCYPAHNQLVRSVVKRTLQCGRSEVRFPGRSAAWRSGLERRFYDDHDRKVNGLTRNRVSLLRPWIRCFTMIISAWWNLTSSKLKKSEAKFNRKTRKQRQLLSESGFVQRIAPAPLSRDRKIKMKKSINRSNRHGVANGSLSLRCFFEGVLPRRKAAEMGPATHSRLGLISRV